MDATALIALVQESVPGAQVRSRAGRWIRSSRSTCHATIYRRSRARFAIVLICVSIFSPS